MENLKDYILGVCDGIKLLKREQLITGEKNHPRLVKQKFTPPEYIKPYDDYTDFLEIAVVVKGKCGIFYGGNSYIMKEKDICVINHDIRHFEKYTKANVPYEILWFIYPCAYRIVAINAVYDPKKGYKFLRSMRMPVNAGSFPKLEAIFHPEGIKKDFIFIRGVLLDWFGKVKENIIKGKYELRTRPEDKLSEIMPNIRKLNAAIEYVNNNYRTDISLKDVSDNTSLSPGYLSSLFRKVYDLNITEFITNCRLREARALLKTSDLSIKEIAFKVGYNDQFFFSKIFKRYYGFSPAVFRKRAITPIYYNPFLQTPDNK